MLYAMNYINNYVDELMKNGDPRIKSWPLMSSPFPTFAICLTYAALVKVVLPRYMRDRKPFNLRWLMVAYNFAMVYVSFILFYKLGVHGWFGKYNYKCQPVDYSDSEDAIGMMKYAYLYYLSKFIEFIDTFFFCLRKKFGHVSTLHVIHHGLMPMSVWWGAKFTPGGHSTFFAFLNSFVHILMYFYYGMSSIGPQMSKYLFWKPYMTIVQMVQFIMIFVHSFQLLFRECNYPKGFMWFIGFHAVLFWFLFYDFFYTSYTKKRKPAVPVTIEKSGGLAGEPAITKQSLQDERTSKLDELEMQQAKYPNENGLVNRKVISADLLKKRDNEFETGRNQY